MPDKGNRSTSPTPHDSPKGSRLADTTENKQAEEVVDAPEDSELYPIKGILDEREGKYKINWAGKDPKTKKPWRPTWEPIQNVTRSAIEHWEQRKRERGIRSSRHSTRVRSTPPRSSRETPRRDRRSSIKPPLPPQSHPARPHYVTPSNSPSAPPSSVRSEEQGGNLPEIQDNPVPRSNPSLELSRSQLGTQDRQGCNIHQGSSNSNPTQPSCGYEDLGIGSQSPQNESLRVARATTTVISVTPSKSLGQRDFNHEHHTNATGTAEPDSLFIPDSLPPQKLDSAVDFGDDFDVAVIAVQRSPLRLPSPKPEADLDRLEPVPPLRQPTDDILARQPGPGSVSWSRSAYHISQNRSSSEVNRTFETPPVPQGQFSRGFSAPEQYLSTQPPPHQLQHGVSNSLLSGTAERPSLDSSQARTSAVTVRDQRSQATNADEGGSKHVRRERVSEGRDLSTTPAPTTQQTTDLLRSSLEGVAPRPVAPRTQVMDNSSTTVRATPSSKQSLRERMRSLREEMDIRVSTSADPSGSATPSGPPTAIPDKPMKEQSASEGPIPLTQRVVSRSPPTFVRPTDLGFDDTDMIMMQSSPPKALKFGPGQYAIPIPIEAIAKDEYLRQIGTSALLFRSLLGASTDDSPASVNITVEMERVNTALQSLHQIIAHTDLSIQGTATQHLVAATTVADWSGLTSQKFYFLRMFLDYSKHLEKRVCVVAQQGRLLDILETFLKGRNITHRRLRKPKFSPPNIDGPLIVDLLSMTDLTQTALLKPDLILAFDASFDSEHAGAQRLRGDIPGNNHRKLVPVVHLLAPFSVEHIERCLPPRLKGLARQQVVVKALLKYCKVIGGMRNNDDDPDSGYPLEEHALQLMSFLESSVWPDPGPQMPPLDLNFASEESSPTRELAQPTLSGAESRSMTPGGHKRSLSRDFETPMNITSTSKRQRLIPLGDVTRVSDPVHGSQLERTLRETQQRLEDTKIENADQAKQIRDLQAALARNERVIHDHLKHISQLRNTTSTTTLRLQEHVSALGKLQHRYESRTNEVHELRKQRDHLTEKMALLETKRDNAIKENAKLKEEQVRLQSDLSSARNDLKSAGGTTADIEVLREENRELAREKASAEKRNVSTQSDLDFTRQLYQEISTKAASTANENGRLELQNNDLKRKVENAATHLRHLSRQREPDSYLRRTEELEATLASRNELLRRKDEELRELRKGRGMGTRASSVQPRSPRLGNSRPVSPAPGNLVPMQMARGASALRHPQEFR